MKNNNIYVFFNNKQFKSKINLTSRTEIKKSIHEFFNNKQYKLKTNLTIQIYNLINWPFH